MATKKSEIYRSLWASCDALRGGMDGFVALLDQHMPNWRHVRKHLNGLPLSAEGTGEKLQETV